MQRLTAPARFFLTTFLIVASLFAGAATATEKNEIGIVVLHGKWDSPSGNASGLANYLGREGFRVQRPEMPWSGSRAYDQGADGMVADVSRAVAELKKAGTTKIYVLGHSHGAAGALYYAGREPVSGIILVAAGGHAQSKNFVSHYAPYVAEAKTLVGQGKGAEGVSFVDLNTGGRTRRIKAPAQSVVDYFDPEGPFNTFLGAARIKPDTAVLIVVPSRETEGLKHIASVIRDKLPAGTKATLVEVNAEHLDAPDAAKQVVRDWLLSQ
jgi:triacylglycerol esterase/lipase EstA (alpha/beta hydrolase family)